MSLLTEQIMSCIGLALPPVRFEVSRNDIRKYAVATGQRQARFLAGDEAAVTAMVEALILLRLTCPIVQLPKRRSTISS